MGMTTRDIQESIKDLYHGVNISHEVISNVTDVVTDEVKAWQNRPLDAVYPILYMDGIVIKVHQDGRVIKKTIYLVLGNNNRGTQGAIGNLDIRTGRSKVLVEGVNRFTKPGSEGNFYSLCGWTKGISGSDRKCISKGKGTALYCPYGSQFIEVCIEQR